MKLIEWLFSHNACRQATEFSCHHRPGAAACSDCYDYYKFFYLANTICLRHDCIKDNLVDNLVRTTALTRVDKFFDVIFTSMIFVYIEICDFFQHFRETKSMEINRWASNFMYLLRKFYKMQELAFVYDKAINKFGVASDNAKLIYRGYNKKYFGGVLGGDFDFGDFRKIINQHWSLSPTKVWTKIEIYRVDSVVYFAKLLDITTHLCDHNCLISVKNYLDTFLVEDSICKQARNKFPRSPTFLNVKISNNEFNQFTRY